MELIQQSEIQKESSEFAVELRKVEEKDKVMVNSYAMFQIRQAVSRSEMLLKIRVLKKFHRKALVLESLFNEVSGLKRTQFHYNYLLEFRN